MKWQKRECPIKMELEPYGDGSGGMGDTSKGMANG